MAKQISTKRLAINKTNAQMVAVVGVASFVTVFCLVASQVVFKQNQYQSKVISVKEDARNQLRDNLEAYKSLSKSYQAFNSKDPNIINGSRTGTGDNDGDNARIILDALPVTYDFPALTSSIEKILKQENLKIGSIAGTDDQVNQQSNLESTNPQPVEIPFSFTIESANYTNVQQLITKLQKSIRPLQVDTLDISGGNNDMTITVNAHTYYQPAKSVSITKKVVK